VFGLGIGELALFAVVLIVFVGPKHLPKLMKTMGKTLRTIRGATDELKKTVGYNDLMRATDVRRSLTQSLGPAASRDREPVPAGGSASYKLTMAERDREHPALGVDQDVALQGKPGLESAAGLESAVGLESEATQLEASSEARDDKP
jgi:Sec-independent protein translocase protein TatA